MRTRILTCPALFALAFVGSGHRSARIEPSPPRRHALLIGVQYREATLQLHTKQDLEVIRRTLASPRCGFKAGNFIVLDTPTETSAAGIRRGFQALLSRVQRGDLVFIHYSGHGSQLADANGDENDGLDETWSASDVTPEAGNQILDDEIGSFLERLADRGPSSVTLVMDCCHSGTGLRQGAGKSRRLPDAFLSAKGRRISHSSAPSSLQPQGELARGGNIVLLAAAADWEAAFEDAKAGMGIFTLSLSKAMLSPEVGPGTTVREVFERTLQHARERNSQQTPQLEGAGRDAVFLSGLVRRAEPYYSLGLREVKKVRIHGDTRPPEKELFIPVGSISGITPGSAFAICKAGTLALAPDRILAEAKVASVSAFSSVLAVSDPKKRALVFKAAAPRAFETARAVGGNALSIVLDARLSKLPDWTKIEKAMAGFEVVKRPLEVVDVPKLRSLAGPSSPHDVLIRLSDDPSRIVLERANGTAISIPEFGEAASLVAPALPTAIRRALEGEAQFQFIQGLRNESGESTVRTLLRIKKVRVEETDEKDAQGRQVVRYVEDLPGPAEGEGGTILLREGEFFALEVKNVGRWNAYVTVLDLPADGLVQPLWPLSRLADSAVPFKPCAKEERGDPEKGWVKITDAHATGDPRPIVWRVAPPLGSECIKLIATRERIDLATQLDRERSRNARPRTAIEQLFRMTTMGGRTRQGQSLDSRGWWTSEVNFTVAGR